MLLTVTGRLSFGLVTPARDEATNLTRLAECVVAQTVRPEAWVIVDNGSTDSTREVAEELARQLPWVDVLVVPASESVDRGGPEVRAFMDGVGALAATPDVVVKLDADVSFEPDFFDRLIGRFEEVSSLGIASGMCLEQEGRAWEPRFSTRSHARGATRAYRRQCLADVMPLEPHLAWDTIDELKAKSAGWSVETVADLPFYHHRKIGTRDGSWRAWRKNGAMAYYISYRPTYVLARTVYRAMREPEAIGMLYGYVQACMRRGPRYPNTQVRRLLRDEQRLRHLWSRIQEARGRA